MAPSRALTNTQGASGTPAKRTTPSPDAPLEAAEGREDCPAGALPRLATVAPPWGAGVGVRQASGGAPPTLAAPRLRHRNVSVGVCQRRATEWEQRASGLACDKGPERAPFRTCMRFASRSSALPARVARAGCLRASPNRPRASSLKRIRLGPHGAGSVPGPAATACDAHASWPPEAARAALGDARGTAGAAMTNRPR